MARLLVAEDNEINRHLMSRLLERAGHVVVIAADGEEALHQVSATRPDLVLLDMGLPIVSGWEVARRLKASPDTHGTPILALTAHNGPEHRERAIAAGCDDYEAKPVDVPALLAKIERLLGPSRTSAPDA